MTYLLDTNVCVEFLRRSDRRIVQRLQSADPAAIRLSAITRGELLFGALRSSRPAEAVAGLRPFLDAFTCLAFDDGAAAKYAELRAALVARGSPIGANDMLIAATALAHDLTLVTHNTREFRRVIGLRIEDWQT